MESVSPNVRDGANRLKFRDRGTGTRARQATGASDQRAPQISSVRHACAQPRLDARRALKMGLGTAVYPTEGFDAEALAVARQLADDPTEA